MKFKSIILSSVAVLGLVSSTGCSDVLDVAPDGKLTMDEILSDPTKVSAMLATCYRYIPQKGYTYRDFDNLPVSMSDDGWSTSDGTAYTPIISLYADNTSAKSHPMRDNAGMSGASFIGGYWANYWGQIYQCNRFIHYAPQAAFNSEAERERNVAEARVLRAFFYLELAKWFGQLPIIDYMTTYNDDFSSVERKSMYEVAKFVIEDCDAAIACDYLPWRITMSSERMRVTKAVACAIKSQISLMAASPLFNEGNNYWEWAYQTNLAAVKALEENGYELFTKCSNTSIYGTGKGNAFREYNCKPMKYSASPADRETIWQHSFDENGSANASGQWIWHIGYIGCGEANTVYCGINPTQELIDAFDTTDGVPVLDLAAPYADEKHLTPNYNPANTLYDANNPYENRDPRMHATALCNGDKFVWNGKKNNEVQAYVGGKHEIRLTVGDRTHSRTGYYYCRTVAPNVDGARNQYGERFAWKFFRLGEIYLNLAEAAVEAGYLKDAVTYGSKTRARVGMPDLPLTSQDQLRLRVRNERRCELAWEENRYFDLRRWAKPDEDLSATCKWLTGMQITKNADGTLTYERVNCSASPRGGYSSRDKLLPIPVGEASLMEAINGKNWQNPGW